MLSTLVLAAIWTVILFVYFTVIAVAWILINSSGFTLALRWPRWRRLSPRYLPRHAA